MPSEKTTIAGPDDFEKWLNTHFNTSNNFQRIALPYTHQNEFAAKSPSTTSRQHQDMGDFLFCLGLRKASHAAYRRDWVQLLQSQESTEGQILALAACLRSAINPGQLETVIYSVPDLRYLYDSITQLSGSMLKQKLNCVYKYLQLQLIWEACRRIGVKTNYEIFYFVPGSHDNRHIQQKISELSPQVKLLLWDFMVVQRVRFSYAMPPEAISRLLFPALGFLRTLDGHELWLRCLICCRTALQVKYAENCLGITQAPEDNHWIYEAAMFCFLWKDWKSKGSSAESLVSSTNGISPAHLFRTIATLIMKKALSQKFEDEVKGKHEILPLNLYLFDAIRSLSMLAKDEVAEIVQDRLCAVWRNPDEEVYHMNPQAVEPFIRYSWGSNLLAIYEEAGWSESLLRKSLHL
jgi:hypothetical protein